MFYQVFIWLFQKGENMLEIGTKAPDFSLPDQNGEIHNLKDYKGKKVILYFYPKDNTAKCFRNRRAALRNYVSRF